MIRCPLDPACARHRPLPRCNRARSSVLGVVRWVRGLHCTVRSVRRMQPASTPSSGKRSARPADETPASAAPAARLHLSRWLPPADVAVTVLLFGVLKLYSLNVVPGDEHLYFDMALAVN